MTPFASSNFTSSNTIIMILQQQQQPHQYEQQQQHQATAMIQQQQNIQIQEFYNPTTLWSFLTECLHWQYTGVYWPKGSTGKKYLVDFFYNTDEVVQFCQHHQYHLQYANEYQHWYNMKFGRKHMSFGRLMDNNEDLSMSQPSRKKARTFNYTATKENSTSTMECN